MSKESLIIVCTKCSAKNRIPRNRLQDNPVCGRCKAPLSVDRVNGQPVDITDNTFNEEVLSYKGLVLVDCWAPWCGPCRMVAPVLEALAQKYSGKVKIAKLNVDENPGTASRYTVQSIPTMLLFKNGQKVDTLVGALPKADIEKHLLALM